jgi:hydroxysqualene dehydroxylase
MTAAWECDVVVIGAGYAGSAAAVSLVDQGRRVLWLEAGAMPGGRARRIEYRGLALDNGLHILLGAYRETLALIRRLGGSPDAFLQTPLTLRIDGCLDFTAPKWPAPWNLAKAFVSARGLSFADRLAALRLMAAVRRMAKAPRPPAPQRTTVANLLAATGQTANLRRLLWEPLCVAALNTPPATADAWYLATVLADALLSHREVDSNLILPRHDLSALLPDLAVNHVRRQGSIYSPLQRALAIVREGDGFHVRTDKGTVSTRAVVLATGVTQARALIAAYPELGTWQDAMVTLAFESIHSIYLQYDQSVRLPFPMWGMDQATSQWLFDREALAGQKGLVGVVVSASSPLRHEDHAALVSRVAAEVGGVLSRHGQALGQPLWHKVIVEKQATFAASVTAERPTQVGPWRGLVLAGDYVEGRYPATIEGAVRSGQTAAAALAPIFRPL